MPDVSAVGAPHKAAHKVSWLDRALDALADPVRRERAVVALLASYAAIWSLYGTIAKGSQDIYVDMSEQFVLGRELAFGYDKHPRLPC